MATAHNANGLTDTDILIDELRGIASAAAFLNQQRLSGGVRTSIVSAMELIQGCQDTAGLRAARRLLGRIGVLPITEAASQTAFSLMETLFSSHGLRIADALIAATALEHGLPLYPRNTRHFLAIPHLIAARPY